jgi:hypothetical protein
MKILFITKGDFPDYQSDSIFLGGRALYGADFVDSNKSWYSYKEEKAKHWTTRIANGGNDGGKGYTVCGKLDDIAVDRTDLEAKIRNKYFDYIIYGSISRCQDFIHAVAESYPREKVIFVDGEDDRTIRLWSLPHGLYFKRELTEFNSGIQGVYPIHFALPLGFYVDKVPPKTKMFATVIPGKLDTYIYTINDEAAYYKDYQDSNFGVTMKKAGWDCLRHHEILMNGCVPYFVGLEDCPKSIMVPLPKEKLIGIRTKLDAGDYTEEEYSVDANWLLEYSRKHLTSEALVNYLLSPKS